MIKSILIFVGIFMFVFLAYLFDSIGIALLLFLVGSILTFQWLIVCREYKEAQELCGKILEENSSVNKDRQNNDDSSNNVDTKKIVIPRKIRLDELIYDIELFEKTDDYLKKITKIAEKDFVVATRMNALQCENLKIKINRIKESNSATIGLIAIAFSMMAVLVSLGVAATKVFPQSLVAIICGASLLFILIHIEQYFVTEKRLTTKLFQYNYKQMEQIWLETVLPENKRKNIHCECPEKYGC